MIAGRPSPPFALRPLPAWYALPGSGTALGVILGALSRIEPRHPALGWAGTSGGGMVALMLASGVSIADAIEISGKLLGRRDVLDAGFPILNGGLGLFRGRVLHGILEDVFGGKRMGDLKTRARVTAFDLCTQRPCVIDSNAHPEAYCADAARVTGGIELFFDPVRLRPGNARTYGDGGLVLNVPAGIWDDEPGLTISLRFEHQQPRHNVADLIAAADSSANDGSKKPVRTYAELVGSVVNGAMDAASAGWPSTKTPGVDFAEVVLDGSANGLQFGLARTEIERRVAVGRLCGERALLTLPVR